MENGVLYDEVNGNLPTIPQPQRALSHREFNQNDLTERRKEFSKRCLTFRFERGDRLILSVNPLSTFIGGFLLWLVIIWAVVDHDQSAGYFNEARLWITDKCTWFYVGSQLVWVILIIIIYFKYGHLRLGLDTDRPRYNNFEYFTMVFTTGLSTGLLYDSVNGPIVGYRNENTQNLLLYQGKNTYIAQAQNSLNVTMLHWGLQGFSVYVLPCLLLSVLCYRKGLPLSARSMLYPVFGKKVFGRLGDCVDGFTIVSISFGVATSFNLGSLSMVSGARILFPELEDSQTARFIALWIVAGLSMISAAAGIRMSIRRMSQLCFLVGSIFTLTIALSDNVWYLLNLAVQSFGYYVQFFIGSSTFTAAFLQEGKDTGLYTKDEINWMHHNTVFYWGWWLGWASMVSLFSARLSKGRTIKNVIHLQFFIPMIALFVWFSITGGLAIDMQNRAIAGNITCGMDKAARKMMNVEPWVQRLGCANETYKQFFIIAEKYDDIKVFLQVLGLIITLMYFITSFDSAALVMGIISSNGDERPPLLQRMFWCITIGAVTSILLIYEEKVGRSEVSSFVILAGLPFALLLCFSAISIWRLLKLEPYWRYDTVKHWRMLYGNIKSGRLLKDVLIATLAPWYYLGQIAIREGKKTKEADQHPNKFFKYFQFVLPFYLWIFLLFLHIGFNYVNYIGWTFFIGFVILASRLRTGLRHRHGIQGNVIEDIAILVIYPFTVVQMNEQIAVRESNRGQGAPNQAYEETNVNDAGSEGNVFPEIEEEVQA
ncbi:trimethylamine transporter-like [Clytia hemisphaerica]